MSDSLYVLGVRIDRLTSSEVIERVEVFLAEGRPCHLVTVNPEFVVLAQRNPLFKKILATADLSLPDGIGLIWASRFKGKRLPERVAGVDLVEKLAALCARKGYRPFLLGGLEGVAEAAAAVLRAKNPGLVVAGTYAGSPRPEEEDEIIARIRAARPDILMVAYGAPQQDIWIHRNLPRLGNVVAMGIGGSFDFISGRAKRAPLWMRRAGLEWLHRLIKEPWRWRRMLRLPQFAWLVLREGRR